MTDSLGSRFSTLSVAFNSSKNQSPTPSVMAGTAKTNAPQDRLIVGVDFGTTYSGVAAVYSATPDDIDIIKSWPGANGIRAPA